MKLKLSKEEIKYLKSMWLVYILLYSNMYKKIGVINEIRVK